MMPLKFTLSFVGLALASFAAVQGSLLNRNPKWDSLQVTWGAVPVKVLPSFVANGFFASMPQKKSDAASYRFVPVPESTSCQSNANFVGNRYYSDKDPSVILLFDNNGYIAGIQNSIAKSEVDKDPKVSAWFQQNPWYVKDKVNAQDTYTLTAYFVDPAIICTTGRSQQDFETGGQGMTGSQLSFQIGPSPLTDIIKIPTNKTDIDQSPIWGGGRCFPTMGNHYWYKVSKGMNCDDWRPFFLLYNVGKLTGFGFANFGNFKSTRFEKPPLFSLAFFLQQVPDCFSSAVGDMAYRSTMHVFFNTRCLTENICI